MHKTTEIQWTEMQRKNKFWIFRRTDQRMVVNWVQLSITSSF